MESQGATHWHPALRIRVSHSEAMALLPFADVANSGTVAWGDTLEVR